MSSIFVSLAEARARIPVSEARLLLRHALGCTAAFLEAHGEESVPADAAQRFADWVQRRAAGEPIAYLTGVREFYEHEFEVSPAVLIPRPETELLVELGRAKLAGRQRGAHILDLGTGSGCVAVSLALALPDAQVTAVDISPQALQVAQRNALRHGVALECICSNWLADLAERRFDLIVANPPYIAEGDHHLSQGDLRFEPLPALASGTDGLASIRAIIADALHHLHPGGWLWCEHGYDQADRIRSWLAEAGYRGIEQHRDLAGILRVSGGYRPGLAE